MGMTNIFPQKRYCICATLNKNPLRNLENVPNGCSFFLNMNIIMFLLYILLNMFGVVAASELLLWMRMLQVRFLLEIDISIEHKLISWV